MVIKINIIMSSKYLKIIKCISLFMLLFLVNNKIYGNDTKPMQVTDSFYVWFTTGKYELIEKHWDQSILSDAKITNLSEQYTELWKQITKQYGMFQYVSEYFEIDTTNSNVFKIVRNIVFEKDSLGNQVILNKNNEFIGHFIVPAITSNYKDADYVDISKFEEFDIAFSDNITGKITIPKNTNKKVPCVVLVHGSGPNDLDLSIVGRKPFRDIAYGLASNDVAVLRYNKRTFLKKIKDANNFTIDDETVDDAVAAVDFVKKNYANRIDKIYILGISQGGYAMPRIAKKSKTASGFISVAGSVRYFELIKEQFTYLADVWETESNKLEETIKQIDFAASGNYSKDTTITFLGTSIPAVYLLDLINYEPVKEFKNEKRPILFIQGGRDYQVPVKEFDLWKDGLSKNKNCKFVLIDNLNHILQEGGGRSVPSEYSEPINVSKKVIDNILDFVK